MVFAAFFFYLEIRSRSFFWRARNFSNTVGGVRPPVTPASGTAVVVAMLRGWVVTRLFFEEVSRLPLPAPQLFPFQVGKRT